MKKLIITLAVGLFAAFTGLTTVKAATSYLLIQGPFGTDGATETFQWAVNYQPTVLANGYDLLTAALTSDQLQSGSDEFGVFVNGFTLSGTSVQNGPWTGGNPNDPNDYSGSGESWTYYTAGASDGNWNQSWVGASSSPLSDGSFDGWVYGINAYDYDGDQIAIPTIAGDANAPVASNFSNATVVNAVPEPGSISMVFVGAAGMMVLLKKRRA